MQNARRRSRVGWLTLWGRGPHPCDVIQSMCDLAAALSDDQNRPAPRVAAS